MNSLLLHFSGVSRGLPAAVAALLGMAAASSCSRGNRAPVTQSTASPPTRDAGAPQPPPVPALAGHTQELRRMTGGGVDALFPAGAMVSITFEPDGVVRGYSGVNTFRGGYRREGAVLTWTGPFASTRRGGSPEAMALETSFLQVLEACVKAEDTADGGLRLSGAMGELVFGPAKDSP